MIYKIGSIDDMQQISFESIVAEEMVYHYASIMTYEYGANRNIDTDDGGYILYATLGTNAEAIKAFFDYTQNVVEFVDRKADICSAIYILSSDYGVVVVMSLADAPPEILKAINDNMEV